MKLAWRRLEGRSGHDVGRELLRELTGELPEILVTERGKPYFADHSAHFSISHTNDHAFCAVSDRNIGIDAEEIGRNVSENLARRILSPSEMARYQASQDPADTLLRLWVQKESYAKLTGRGWGNYLQKTDFHPENVQIIDGCYVSIMEE